MALLIAPDCKKPTNGVDKPAKGGKVSLMGWPMWLPAIKRSETMKTIRMNDLIDRLNAIRAAAGLPPRAIHGTSKQAVQIMINRAQRGEF